MNYQSTRGGISNVTASYAIKNGIASDGGLFVPMNKINLSVSEIERLSTLSYTDLAAEVLGMYLTDYSPEELLDCTNGAYTKEKFETDSIAPVYKLNENTYILELWHGPTCAFKDMALQILPHLLTRAIKKTGEDKEVVILVATSGDTGKAALEGFKNVPGTRIQVFYPDNGVSEIQKLQMTTQEGNNVDVVAVKGNFDDAQTGVKKIFTDKAFADEIAEKGFAFSSANSINWGRLAPQIVYYFAAYCDLLRNGEINAGDKINICVPTGNFGNILAAYYAKCMGLPVGKLICASNINNVLTDFINTGVYDRNRNFETTVSPSMDILISSNLERFLFHATDGDTELVSEYMKKLSEDGRYEVNDKLKSIIKDNFYASCCDDDTTIETIKNTHDKFDYIVDTHTAVGVYAYNRYVEETGDTTKTVIASTANPFKFNNSVLSALVSKKELEGKDEFQLLQMLSDEGNIRIPKSLKELKNKFVRFNTVCERDNLKEETSRFLNI